MSDQTRLRPEQVDDGSAPNHGPTAGCNFNACGLGDEPGCPFVKSSKGQAATSDGHIHHYVLACSCGDTKPITT